MSSITTKGGDGGDSSLYSGERLRKSDLFFETLGTLDELNSWMGVVRAHLEDKQLKSAVEASQRALFRVASNIATKPDTPLREQIQPLTDSDLEQLEAFQGMLDERVKMPTTFVIPGQDRDAAWADVARTVCRRAERSVIRLADHTGLSLKADIKYLNRLSDVLFMVARYLEEGGFLEK